MDYIELRVLTDIDFADILIAELAEIGFETFIETDEGLNAYIIEEVFDKNSIEEIFSKYANQTLITFDYSRVEKKNWNDEWEKNYETVKIDDICLIRASFHPSENFPYEIIINPKMSFGTGHHETTYLMIKNQLKISHVHKVVLDVGCGTGILGIMASKLAASYVDSFDIEEWAVENAKENFELNDCKNSNVQQGTIETLHFNKTFDIILANISRNILLKEIPEYSDLLNIDGFLLLSGFYESDAGEIKECAISVGLKEIEKFVKNSWAAVIYQKTH